MDYISIAIDGPAGAGKSTIVKKISNVMNINYLDTGAMYRAIAYAILAKNYSTDNENEVLEVLNSTKLEIKYINSEQRVFINDFDVTAAIRTPEISKAASDVAIYKQVRIKLVEIQREIANKNNIVMDGRDIGTYVLPNASLKIFLTASVEERARRRYQEYYEKWKDTKTIDDVIDDINKRDENDSKRDFAPLLKADDAIEIDTTKLSIEQVTDLIYEKAKILG